MSESLAELARIGEAAGAGVTRVAWSSELFEAYEWVAERMRALGLEVEIDAAGNLIGCWQGDAGSSAVLVGSHLDTVPSGGAFDGALGVVGAVHAVARLKEEGFEPARPLWIVAFMDEEGTRFNTALFGSRAFTGEDLADLGARVDAAGLSLREVMAGVGFDLDHVGAAYRVDEIGAYLELHIEQGPVLEAAEAEIGVVTSIVGLRGYRVRLKGQANHAGTTPMTLRRDSLAGAARIALELRDVALAREAVTVTVGKLVIQPGGANVVPGLADFTIDVRSPSADELHELEKLVEETVASIAAEEGLAAELEQTFALESVELEPALVDVVEQAAQAERARAMRMVSGAGHDAMLVGRRVPGAMIFVPSRDGISHSPREYSSPDQVELGVRVLTGALRQLLNTDR